jgi:hypothetical protein
MKPSHRNVLSYVVRIEAYIGVAAGNISRTTDFGWRHMTTLLAMLAILLDLRG